MAEASQLVTVVDTLAPEVVLGLDSLLLECGSALPTNLPVFGDLCDDMVVTEELDSIVVEGDCTGQYTVTRHPGYRCRGNTRPTPKSWSSRTRPRPTSTRAPFRPTRPSSVEALPDEVPTAMDGCRTWP